MGCADEEDMRVHAVNWMLLVVVLGVGQLFTGCCSHNPDRFDEAEVRLHAAAIEGSTGCFKKYLAEEPDIDVPNKYGETSLHLAAKHGHLDIVKVLVEKNANVNAIGNPRNSALHYAMKPASKGEAIAQVLLQRKADPNIVNHRRQVPLHLTGNPAMITALMKSGALATYEDDEGYTPVLRNMLDTTTSVADHDYVRMYLKYGLDPNHLYPIIDQGLVHWAIEKNRMDIFELVMERKPNVELLDRSGRPPLYLAMEEQRAKMAIALMEAGASPMGHRVLKGNPEVYETVFNGAVRRLDVYYTVLLLRYGAKAGGIGFSPDGSSPLINLCRLKVMPKQLKAQAEIFDILVKAGADPNTPMAFGDALFPLHAAVSQKNLMLVEKLLSLGASVNAKTASGQTPLHFAAQTGDEKVAKRLLAGGASKLIENEKGQVARKLAFDAGFLDLAGLLE